MTLRHASNASTPSCRRVSFTRALQPVAASRWLAHQRMQVQAQTDGLVRRISALSCPRMACVKTTSLSCVAGSLGAHRAATSRRHRQRHEARAAAAGNGANNATQQQPQRGVVILPGLGNSAADYTAIAADLEVQTAVEADIGMICPKSILCCAGASCACWRHTNRMRGFC